MVVKEVVAELSKMGIQINMDNMNSNSIEQPNENKRCVLDLSKFKTPLVTEEHILNLSSGTKEVIVPKGTVITPNARDLIRKNKLTIISNLIK